MSTVADLKLPSRYEDLDPAFRGSLLPNHELIGQVQAAYQSMRVGGGIRFLPMFGKSGSGKSSAALELSTHLPESRVISLTRQAIQSRSVLIDEIAHSRRGMQPNQLLIAVIDQYEESVAERGSIPSSFVESLALLDRGEFRTTPILFIWLTTSREFQKHLADATSRNRRILVSNKFELAGPDRDKWPHIIEETFRFHNNDRDLADFEVLHDDLKLIAEEAESLGDAIGVTGGRLSAYTHQLHDVSKYLVIMLWPVSDGLRIQRVQQFTDARQGYKLDWYSWYRDLNSDDKKQLPLQELNRARLYFDVRLVPIAVADLFPLCKELDDDAFKLQPTYLDRFSKTHFSTIVSGQWSPDNYAPLRERTSARAETARAWYDTVTNSPTKLGKRIARIISENGLAATHEKSISSPNGTVRADVFISRGVSPPNVIVELKAFSPQNTMPSTISDAIKTTLRRHAQFAGFLQKA